MAEVILINRVGRQGCVIDAEFVDGTFEVRVAGVLGMSEPIVGRIADNGGSERHVAISRHQSAINVEQSSVGGTVQSPDDLRFLFYGWPVARPLDNLFVSAAVGSAGAAQVTISGRQRQKHVIGGVVSKVKNTRPGAATGIGDPSFDRDGTVAGNQVGRKREIAINAIEQQNAVGDDSVSLQDSIGAANGVARISGKGVKMCEVGRLRRGLSGQQQCRRGKRQS